MNDWVEVNPGDASRETEKTIRGVTVKVSASPYDVPTKVRGYREKDSNFFVIDLQYIVSGEPTHQVKPSPDMPVFLEVGNTSERIYKIKVDVVHFKSEAVRLEVEVERGVEGAISKFSSNPNRIQDRYVATGQAIRSNSDALFGSLV